MFHRFHAYSYLPRLPKIGRGHHPFYGFSPTRYHVFFRHQMTAATTLKGLFPLVKKSLYSKKYRTKIVQKCNTESFLVYREPFWFFSFLLPF